MSQTALEYFNPINKFKFNNLFKIHFLKHLILCIMLTDTSGHLVVNVTSTDATVQTFNPPTSMDGFGVDPVLKLDQQASATAATGLQPAVLELLNLITEKLLKATTNLASRS